MNHSDGSGVTWILLERLEPGRFLPPPPTPVQIQGFKCPRKTSVTTEQEIRKAWEYTSKRKSPLFRSLILFTITFIAFMLPALHFTTQKWQEKETKQGPSCWAPPWESGRRAVFGLPPTVPLSGKQFRLCSPPGVMAAPTVNHVFHSVLSLPISQQGHIPPSFSPLTVKPYHQAECFKVSGNSIHSGSVNSWDTLSLKIKLVNVQHKLLFFKQCKMVYFENGSSFSKSNRPHVGSKC